MRARIRQVAAELLAVSLWAIVVFVALWSVGAAAGVVVSGFCMVSGCG